MDMNQNLTKLKGWPYAFVYLEKFFKEEIGRALKNDNTDEFTTLLANHFYCLGESDCIVTQHKLLKLICVHGAAKCANALLMEEAGQMVDLNVAPEGELLGLQLAAESLSLGVTQTFLKHGALANVSDKCGSKDHTMLPLRLALEALSRNQYICQWTPEKSIFKLFYIFCLKDLKEALDTIKLLAENTDDVEKIGLQCVEDGEVSQFAALLMVAWDRLVPCSLENAEESLIAQHIREQIGLINDQESKLLTMHGPKSEALQCLKNKRTKIVMEWRVFKILEIARDVIQEYFHGLAVQALPNHAVPFEVAYGLFIEAKLELKPDDLFSDDIECLRPKLSLQEKAKLNEDINNHLRSIFMPPKLLAHDEVWPVDFLGKNSMLSTADTWEKPPLCLNSGKSVESLPSISVYKEARSSSPPKRRSPSSSYPTLRSFVFNIGKPGGILPSIPVQKEAIAPFSVLNSTPLICARLFLTAKRSLR